MTETFLRTTSLVFGPFFLPVFVFFCLWSSGLWDDRRTLVNVAQATTAPLITLHLEELLHIYHSFKPTWSAAFLTASARTHTHTESVLKVLAEHKPRSLLSPVNAAKHFCCLHRRFDWNDIKSVEIKGLLRVSKQVKTYQVFSPGVMENFLPGRLLVRTLSSCDKSQWQDLQEAHVNMKYGCSDTHESPTQRRCASESCKVREDIAITWTHVLLKKTPNEVVCWILCNNANDQSSYYHDNYHKEAEI